VYAEGSGEQVAYARVVTDRATFAWLCDVYVDPSVRGKGLGTAMVAAVRDHLEPYGLRRVLLATHDAHGVYAKLGFQPLAEPDRWMALVSE
jgi:GNAT superfamily N-acetyltransferase